jgi:D-alanyl-D-alanine endopeptidase (penicillin-binding protein 7)
MAAILVGALFFPTQSADAATRKSVRAKAHKAAKAPSPNAERVTRVRVIKLANGKRKIVRSVVFVEPPKPSLGQLAGLHQTSDPLELRSSVALVMDQGTNEVLFSKNPEAVLPIASITKLMTAMVVLDAGLDLNEELEITAAEIDTEKGTRSRLTIGTRLPRTEMLHLALMSSENRAAHALGRNYPGGVQAFIAAMNAKAKLLGMQDTVFHDPTGLSSSNRSSARDLVKLVNAAHTYPLIRQYSTDTGTEIASNSGRVLRFNNTNRLVSNPDWQIGVQKTGFISEAGQCLVMQTSVAGRSVIMVFLDSFGKLSRIADAVRVRRWLESAGAAGASLRSAAPIAPSAS